MKKSCLFLASIVLSGICLTFSSSVFAGNPSCVSCKITSSDICRRINLVEKKILFECTQRLLSELNSIILTLKGSEVKISLKDKTKIFDRLKRIIDRMYFLKTEGKEEIAKLYEDVQLFSYCYCSRPHCNLNIQCAPKLKPQVFKGGVFSISMNDLPPLVAGM